MLGTARRNDPATGGRCVVSGLRPGRTENEGWRPAPCWPRASRGPFLGVGGVERARPSAWPRACVCALRVYTRVLRCVCSHRVCAHACVHLRVHTCVCVHASCVHACARGVCAHARACACGGGSVVRTEAPRSSGGTWARRGGHRAVLWEKMCPVAS